MLTVVKSSDIMTTHILKCHTICWYWVVKYLSWSDVDGNKDLMPTSSETCLSAGLGGRYGSRNIIHNNLEVHTAKKFRLTQKKLSMSSWEMVTTTVIGNTVNTGTRKIKERLQNNVLLPFYMWFIFEWVANAKLSSFWPRWNPTGLVFLFVNSVYKIRKSEWGIEFNDLSRKADIGVQVIQISSVITTSTLNSIIFPYSDNT